jgi:hypothetical protein
LAAGAPHKHAGHGIGGRGATGPPAHLPSTMPGLALAAPSCRLWPRRHVPRVAWPGVPPPRGGLFWQKISQGVLSGISLVQVVQCVKNSCKFSGCK